MIFIELYIADMYNKKILKKYKFNPYGVNIILGVAKKDSNGVGKSAMVDSIRYLLGQTLPIDFKNRQELYNRDIAFIMKVKIGDKLKYLARTVLDADNGYISDNMELTVVAWELYDIKEYQKYIQDYIYQNINIINPPSFNSIREYIIRDEKQGFNDIGLINRKALTTNQILSFLALLPFHYEVEINKLKNEKKNLENEIKVIKTIAKDISKLKMDKLKIETEVLKLKDMLDNVSISEKIDYDETKYIEAKANLKEVEGAIFRNEYTRSQFNQNIKDLENKHIKMKEIIDLKDFYNQVYTFFPEQLSKNYDEMQVFFEFMLENRGEYFRKRILEINQKLLVLQTEKRNIQSIITESTKLFQNSQVVDDIHNLNEQLNVEYEKLADVKMKIDKYNEINDLTNSVNNKEKEIINKTTIYEEDYKQYKNNIKAIESYFNSLLNEAYGELGALDYEFENNIKGNFNTGRIKINCHIDDEGSHGRLYMKINMFDLALFMNRIEKNCGCMFLIHDGSYSKPNADAKEKLIKYIDKYLKEVKRGQYIITLNKDEVTTRGLNDLINNNMVIVELDRGNNEINRFFGFRY